MATNKDTLKKVTLIFLAIIVIIGIVSLIVSQDKMGALLGLAIGAGSVIVNYFLLHKLMKFVVTECPFCAVQTYIVRLFIYLMAVIGCVEIGSTATYTFAAAVVSLSLAIVIVYGIKGILPRPGKDGSCEITQSRI